MATNIEERRTVGSTTTGRKGGGASEAWPRIVNAVLGVWLFISAFLWTHSATSRTNTWVVGLLAVGFAVWGMWAPAARFLNTALSVWLFFSTIAIFHLREATLWNNIIVAIALFVISLVPNTSMRSGHRPPRYVEA